MNELITREYHFGGGNAGDDFFTKKAAPTVIDDDDEAPGSPVRKTKKEVRQGIAGRHPDSRHRMAHASSLHPAPQVMAELIAKSKAAKHERAQEKDADQAQLEELDATFKQLADVRPAQAASHTALACPVLTWLPPCAGGRAAQQPADVHGAHEGGSEAGRQPQGQARRARARGRGRRRFRPAGAHAPGATCPPLMRLTCAIRQARMLASDIRASRVTDRLKTADELAAEKAKQLEELERKRMKRMRSRGSDDEAESSDDDAPQGGFKARRLKRQKREPGKKRRETVRCFAFACSLCGSRLTERAGQGDDDLDGNVAFDDGNGGSDEGGSDQPEDEEAEEEEGDDDDEAEDPDELRQSFKEKARSINRLGDLRRGKRRLRRLGLLNDGGSVSSSAEEEEDEEEEEEGEGEEDSDEDEDEGTGDEAGGDEAEEDAPGAEHREADDEPAAATASGADGDLPYVFDAPTSHAELARWVDGRPPEELSLVITRICACHAIALAPENRRKMQTFFGVLVVHFERLAQQSPMPSAHLDAMVPHLLALSREVPYYAATVARARLSKMQASVAESQQRGVFEWPPSRTLSLLRLFALIFPASDFRHAVLTPAALLLGQYLAHCEVRSVRDAAVGVLAATLAQELASASKRFVPEVLAFTSSLVHANSRGSAGLPVHHASQMGEPVLAVDLPKGSKAAMHALQVAEVLSAPAEDALFERDDVKLGVLHAALSVLANAADQAASLPSALVMLAPARDAVERLHGKAKRLPPETAAVVAAIVTAHERASSAVHAPLQLHARKAEPIKTFNPRFEEEGYVKGRDYDVDRERSEKRKLKKQLQRETKGAARELRKDNRFLADERAKIVASASAEREAKHRAALSFLEQQEADFKSGGQGGMMKRKKK